MIVSMSDERTDLSLLAAWQGGDARAGETLSLCCANECFHAVTSFRACLKLEAMWRQVGRVV
jgi:hypothetical protein